MSKNNLNGKEITIKVEKTMKEKELCRFCAERSFDYTSVFTDDLHKGLKTHFGILIEETDNWPKTSCRSCFSASKICLDFITKIRKSETTFRDLYGEWKDVEIKHEIEMIDIKLNPLEDEFENEVLEEEKVAVKASKRSRKCKQEKVFREGPRRSARHLSSSTEIKEETETPSSPSHSPIFMEALEDPEDVSPPLSTSTKETDKKKKRKLSGRDENKKYSNQIPEEKLKKIEEFFKMDCDLCQQSYTKLRDLQAHYREVHKRKGYVKCCNIKFNRPFKVLEHLEHHLNPDAFKCHECGKKFKNRYGLQLHTENSHTPPELHKYKCPNCPKTFMSIHRHRNHLAVHVKESDKSHFCPHCNKAFALNSNMQIHVKLMHQKVSYHVCEICAKMFKNKDVFKRHQKTHTGEKIEKLPCPVCGRLFNYDTKLKLHIARHNLSKEIFQCHICKKISPNKQALQSHIKYVHIRERIHKCKLCGAAFKVKQRLAEHMATHTSNQILYTCLFCPKQFNSSANKYAHQKRQHPVEYEEMKLKKDAESLGRKIE
ncbi:transcription factor grauzone-like [Lutzomyia longipalpis]|uniref:transcription factor grauzone-like n=1 Tax=Lutzomyia longipalpis TaxID=7200 RepID=UPI0024841F59|nr:transcription factor grauzone-like [Lutzomyia longipalpis]